MDLHTRNQYMKAMGIPVWMPRLPEEETMGVSGVPTDPAQPNQPINPSVSQPPTPGAPPTAASIATIVSDTTRPVMPPTTRSPDPVKEPSVTTPDCSAMGWPELQESVRNCQLCGLHRSRTQTVFGTGDRHANWMIIGEAPGANEDRQGEPFVGKAGKLLNNMLAAVGLPREAVYIGNVLKCRPPNNRDPKPEESTLCRGYLERQIALVKPVVIIVVGRIAAHNLLQVTTPLGRLRGTPHQLPGSEIPVIVTYHPAYLLRQPSEKRKAWQDLQLARQVMLSSEQ